MYQFCANDPLDAWTQAAGECLNRAHAERFYVTAKILNPTHVPDGAVETMRSMPHHLRVDDPNSVINTVFPVGLWRRSADREDLYARYERIFERKPPRSWGTYFKRMIDVEGVNQLERTVECLSRWTRGNKTALTIHTSTPGLDRPRTRGAPCLQYIEVLSLPQGQVDLFAVYRNHDVYNKYFGNVVALGQLLQFVSSQAAKVPRYVVCSSVHLYSSDTKAKLRELLARAT